MNAQRKRLMVNSRWCKGCGICVEFCPGKVLGLNKQKVRVVAPENCTRCGLCEMRCPDYAIWLEDEEGEEFIEVEMNGEAVNHG